MSTSERQTHVEYFGRLEVHQPIKAGAAEVAACTCTNFCSDDHSLINCAHCQTLDVYDPCPAVGFGCGKGCDCCTPEQQKAADS